VNVHFVDLLIVFSYLLLMLYLGYKGWKASKTASDYLVAGRSLGYGLYVGCLAAVVLGGGSTVGSTKLGYQYGISAPFLRSNGGRSGIVAT